MTPRVKVIVDSTSDLPPEWLARWDIQVLHAHVNFGGESFPDDGIALPRQEFYRRLAAGKGLPLTSAPAPGVAQALIEKQLAKSEHVVVFTLASQFSSIYNTVRLAAQEFDSRYVTVVDSGQVTMGLGWLAAAAAEAAERGANRDEVLAAVQSTRSRLRLYAAIDTLEYLKRSGRVNTFVASIGTLLQIKPIIEVREGAVKNIQRTRSIHKAAQVLVDLARAEVPLDRLAVLHSNFPEGAADLFNRVKEIAPADAPVITRDISTALGTHLGPGSLGLSYVRKNL